VVVLASMAVVCGGTAVSSCALFGGLASWGSVPLPAAGDLSVAALVFLGHAGVVDFAVVVGRVAALLVGAVGRVEFAEAQEVVGAERRARVGQGAQFLVDAELVGGGGLEEGVALVLVLEGDTKFHARGTGLVYLAVIFIGFVQVALEEDAALLGVVLEEVGRRHAVRDGLEGQHVRHDHLALMRGFHARLEETRAKDSFARSVVCVGRNG